jgi:glycine betaine/proline transport system permease protein
MTIALSTNTVVRRAPRGVIAVGVIGLLIAAQVVLSKTSVFPSNWDIGFADPINTFQSWVSRNRDTNFFISNALGPIGDLAKWGYNALLDALNSLPWFLLPILVFVIVIRSGNWVSASLAAGGLVYAELAGLHKATMETIALSLACVLLCVLIGCPIGIWAGLNARRERKLKPVLDFLQSLPPTIYLAPALLFFGIGAAPAVIATVAFAIAPMIRITALGIRQVPTASVEAGQMFGSTPRQLLWKVRLPQATPTIVTGINQTIMAALSMAVIASLVGAQGLGAEVFQTLSLRSPGRGFLVGLAILAIAVAFDRVTRSLIERPKFPEMSGSRFWFGLAGGLAVLYVVGRLGTVETVPFTFDRGIAEPIDDLVTWIRDQFGGPLQSINDFVVRDIAINIRDFFGGDTTEGARSKGFALAWPVVIGGVSALAWWLHGQKLAIFAAVGLFAIGLLGTWGPALETLAQLLVALALAIAVAIPLGIYLGTREKLEARLNPIFELFQTMPNLIYAIPFTMIFAVGFFPGILATALYAIPAGVRLAAMAVRRVEPQALEASTIFGATPWQRLMGVRVPMAMSGIMLGINQVIMMSISMVLITGLTGSQGLGYLLVSGLRKPDTGLALEAGLTLVVMGILLDRLAAGIGNRLSGAKSS